MAGAAAVLARHRRAVADEKLPVEVHALAACTENMPSGNAYKLGDVLRSMAGKTVEINNTDAEGRLTLGDALTYGLALQARRDASTSPRSPARAWSRSGRTPPASWATTTRWRASWLAAGAARRRGHVAPAAAAASHGAAQVRDRRHASNTGERWGGALTAGLFLKEFVGDVPWVHVDIAGPSSADKEYGHVGKGGTGFAVGRDHRVSATRRNLSRVRLRRRNRAITAETALESTRAEAPRALIPVDRRDRVRVP